MTEEKRKLLNKINEQIYNIKYLILEKFPSVHEIEDGFVIRFFYDWNNCFDNTKIKYRKILNKDNSEEINSIFFIPKGTIFKYKKKDYINYVTCINGSVLIETKNETIFLNSYNKIKLESNDFYGKALENTYLITSNMEL